MRGLKSIFILSACAGVVALSSCESNVQNTTVNYPETEKIPVVDTYFEEEVIDNYRWLEDDRSAETEDWVKRQNETTFSHLNGIAYKEELKARLEKLWNYEKISRPFKEGPYTYFYKNDGLQNQSVVYRQKGDSEEAEVFLDPNSFSEDGTVSLAGLSFTEDGSLLAYSISEGGSDWRKIIVLDAETKEQVGDTIIDVKFSGISWKKNEGFYYSSYDKPDGSELSAKTDQHKLYFHRLGTSQEEDQLVYGGTPEEKHRYIGGSVSEDARFLFISASNTTSGNKLLMQDLSVEGAPIVAIVDDETSDTYVTENEGSTLFLVTDRDAPNKRLVKADAKNPAPENWVDVIPETENVLTLNTGSGYFFAEYMIDALSKVYQYNYEGQLVREIDLPGLGGVGGFGGTSSDDLLYYTFTNYNTPSSSYTYNPETGASAVYWTPAIAFNSDEYVSEQVFYTSKDGT